MAHARAAAGDWRAPAAALVRRRGPSCCRLRARAAAGAYASAAPPRRAGHRNQLRRHLSCHSDQRPVRGANWPIVRLLPPPACASSPSSSSLLARREILCNIVAGQGAHHEPMGGIVPNVATQRHSARLPSVVVQALSDAGRTIADVDVVAVTRGPGLPPCLGVGLNAAKTLAAVSGKPLAPVHHMVRKPPPPRTCEREVWAAPTLTAVPPTVGFSGGAPADGASVGAWRPRLSSVPVPVPAG